MGHPRSDENAGFAIFNVTEGCTIVAGNIHEPVGWRDGLGDDARFSRPHAVTKLDDQLVLTDIDNHALRVVDVHRRRVASVVYDRNLFGRWWLEDPDPPLLDVVPLSTTPIALTKSSAEIACRRRNYSLCDPTDLVNAYSTNPPFILPPKAIVWTSRLCSSCWLKLPGTCPAPNSSTDSAEHRSSAAWGANVSVLATLHRGPDDDDDKKKKKKKKNPGDGGGGVVLRAECRPDTDVIDDLTPLCCRPPLGTAEKQR